MGGREAETFTAESMLSHMLSGCAARASFDTKVSATLIPHLSDHWRSHNIPSHS